MVVVGRSNEPDAASQPQTILIVEDEIFIRLALADDLAEAGFCIFQAAGAEEALQVLQSSLPIDVMITDIRMPGALDGLELAMRARTAWPELRILLLSGNLADLPPGVLADALIAKPYNPTALIAQIRQLLNGAERCRAT
jgi:DNA-binding response OmpR family regulator